MAIVTVDDLVAYMSGVSLTDDQRTLAAPTVLDGVQAALESWLNRPIQPVLVREIGLSDANRNLYTTVTPIHYVQAVTAVTETAGDALIPSASPALTSLSLDDFQSFANTTVGGADHATTVTVERMDVRPQAPYIYCDYADTYYEVTYVGGYNGFADAGLRLAILRVAAREMTANHDDVLSVKEDFAKDTPVQPMQYGWQPHELEAWRRLKRRVLV